MGTGRLPLFSSRLRLRTGERKVAVTPTAAGGARGGKEGEAWAEMRKLDKLLKQYGRGDIPKVGWLDRLSLKQLHRLQAKSEQDALEAGQVFLTVELPSFPHGVLFHERAVIPSGAPFPAATGALATHFIFDPEVGKESPAERKAVKLQRSQEGSTTGVDRDLKPNSSERKEILAILRLPPSHKLDQAACKLLWRFRYSLREDSKALVKFLRSIHWEDVQEVQEAIKLMESWARISTSDALPLLSPDFTNARVRAYAVKVIENEADDEELQDYLLQLVQAGPPVPASGREVVPRKAGRGKGRGKRARVPTRWVHCRRPEGGGGEGDAVDAREGFRQGLSCLMGNLWLPRFPHGLPSSLERSAPESSWRSEPEDRRGGSWSWSNRGGSRSPQPSRPWRGTSGSNHRRGGPGAQEGVPRAEKTPSIRLSLPLSASRAPPLLSKSKPGRVTRSVGSESSC